MKAYVLHAREGWTRGYSWYLLGTFSWLWMAKLRARLHLLRFPHRCYKIGEVDDGNWHPYLRGGRAVERQVLESWFSDHPFYRDTDAYVNGDVLLEDRWGVLDDEKAITMNQDLETRIADALRMVALKPGKLTEYVETGEDCYEVDITVGTYLPECWLNERPSGDGPDPWTEDFLTRCAQAVVEVLVETPKPPRTQ